MAERHLVRARRENGAPLRRLNLDVLRKALSRLLIEDDDEGLLVYQLVVEGTEPALVAAERSTAHDQLLLDGHTRGGARRSLAPSAPRQCQAAALRERADRSLLHPARCP
jgi:hypothetical protein